VFSKISSRPGTGQSNASRRTAFPENTQAFRSKKQARFKGEKFVPETEEEKEARLKREAEEADAQLKKERETFFEIDAEREIDKGLEKELTPLQILRHLKGWEATDGDHTALDKLTFDIFHKYFSRDYAEVAPRAFFESWAPLLKFLLPDGHTKNQLTLLYTAQSVWATSKKDAATSANNNKRATEEGAIRTIFKFLLLFKIVQPRVLLNWRDDKSAYTGKEAALEELSDFLSTLDAKLNGTNPTQRSLVP